MDVIEAINEVLRSAKTTTLLVVCLVALSPLALNVYLLAERSGYVQNASQVEHQAITARQRTIETSLSTLAANLNTVAQGVVMTNAVQNDLAYFLQLICVQQARTPEDRDKGCLAPAWRRTLEVKP